jgi:hypothetical protein
MAGHPCGTFKLFSQIRRIGLAVAAHRTAAWNFPSRSARARSAVYFGEPGTRARAGGCYACRNILFAGAGDGHTNNDGFSGRRGNVFRGFLGCGPGRRLRDRALVRVRLACWPVRSGTNSALRSLFDQRGVCDANHLVAVGNAAQPDSHLDAVGRPVTLPDIDVNLK